MILKQLPPVGISADDYEYVEATCREVLAGVRHTADDGTPLYFPGGGYEACWTRDFCYMVEGAGQLIPAEEIIAGIDYLLSGQREDGVMPDRVAADGTPAYLVFGEQPPTDNAQFMVKLVAACMELTGDYEVFLQRRDQLYDAMAQVPRTDDGMVRIDRNRPHSSYGFTDTVAKSGKVFFSSLLYWEATRKLAKLCAMAEYHDEAHTWYEQAEPLAQSLEQFYDDEYGLYRAASDRCNQLDLWGSAYAAVLRLGSKSQERQTGQFFCEVSEASLWQGHVRHLPAGEYWEELLTDIEPETYQNGAYWAVPSGWAAQAMALHDEDAARAFIAELLEVWRTEGVFECISPYAAPQGAGYAASAACLLGAVRPHRRLG